MGWVEGIICQYSWQWGRSPHQSTSLWWKAKSFCLKTFYTIYFRQTQRRCLSHGVCTKIMIIHITPQSNSGCRTIWTTICCRSSCKRAAFILILCFNRLKIVIPTWYFFSFFLPKADVTHVRWTTKPLLSVSMSKSYHRQRPWSTWEECLILPSLQRTYECLFERYRVHF